MGRAHKDAARPHEGALQRRHPGVAQGLAEAWNGGNFPSQHLRVADPGQA